MKAYHPTSNIRAQERLAFERDNQPSSLQAERQGQWSRQYPNSGIDPHLSVAGPVASNTAWTATLPTQSSQPRWNNHASSRVVKKQDHGNPFIQNGKYEYMNNSSGNPHEKYGSVVAHGNPPQLLTPPREPKLSPTPIESEEVKSSATFPSSETEAAGCQDLVPFRQAGDLQTGDGWPDTPSSAMVKRQYHSVQTNLATYRGNGASAYHPNVGLHQTGLPLSSGNTFGTYLNGPQLQPTYVGMEIPLSAQRMYNTYPSSSTLLPRGGNVYSGDMSLDAFNPYLDPSALMSVYTNHDASRITFQDLQNAYSTHCPPVPRGSVSHHGGQHNDSASHNRAQPSQVVDRPLNKEREHEDRLLLEGKVAGLTYKDIRKQIGGHIAESTLRGRYRSLTKQRKDRVRKPVWPEQDVELLREFVLRELNKLHMAGCRYTTPEQQLSKVSWKRAAAYIKDQGGSYGYGNATCKKKWIELTGDAPQ